MQVPNSSHEFAMTQLAAEELAAHADLCPDCPMSRIGVLAALIPPQVGICAFRCLSVRARAPLPMRWFEEFGLGVVRRGIVLRQRIDAHGRATVIDAVGAGGLVPLGMAVGGDEDATMGAYAVNDVLLCAGPADAFRTAMDSNSQTPRDVLQLHAQALHRMERLVHARGRMTVIERVAAMLAALVDCLSPLRKTDVISADVHQADLAALVSARQETVCRALRALEERGLIARNAEGIRIPDRQRLLAV